MDYARRTLFIARYTFADFFDRTFKMVGYTAKTTFLVSASLLIPIAVIGRFIFGGVIAGVLDVARSGKADPAAAQIIGMVMPICGMAVLFMVVAVASEFISGVVTLNVAQVASGRTGNTLDIVGLVWERYFGRIFLQGLVKSAIYTGIVTMGFVPALVFSSLAAAAHRSAPALIVLGGSLYLGTFVLLAWCATALFLSTQAIVFDDESVFGSLRSSAYLIRGNWWRLFGTILLSQLVFSFSAGLVTYPIIGASMMAHVPELTRLNSSATTEVEQLTTAARVVSDASGGFAVTAVIQGVLSQLFFPVLWSLFYIDLKVRKRDFSSRRVRSRMVVRRMKHING